MSTVEDAPAEFRRRQRRLFEGWKDLPNEYRLTAAWERLGDLTMPRANERYPEFDAVAIPVTVERYRLQGMDPEPAEEELYYTFAVSEGHWSIVSDTDLEEVGLYSARHLWEEGQIWVDHTEHFSFFSNPCQANCAGGPTVRSASERAYDLVRKYWKQIPERTVVYEPESAEQLERMIQSTFDLDNFVAFAYSSEDPRLGYTGNRVMLNPDAFRGIDGDYAFQIIAHEMVHIATRRAAGPFIPIFVDEGFADHVGYDGAREGLRFFDADVAAGRFDGTLPRDFEFTTGTGTDIFRSYQDSQAAVRFFIERWGLDRFLRFYRQLGSVTLAAGTTRYWVDTTMKEVIGVDLKRFERLWADSIRSR
jgi:hypothetical protein